MPLTRGRMAQRVRRLAARILRGRLSTLWVPRGPFLYEFPGYRLSLQSPRRSQIARSVYFTGQWESAETEFLKAFLKPDMVVWDVGAHIGYYTTLFASIARHVYAFEVNTNSLSVLNKNIEINQFHNITVIEQALFRHRCRLTFHEDRLVLSENDDDTKPTVECIGVDDVLAEHPDAERVDLIKLDVEGAELDILKGASELIETRKPHFIIEVHHGRLPRYGYTPADFYGELKNKDYSFVPVDRTDIDMSSKENVTIHAFPDGR